jgi:hypothetical protein
MDEEFEKSRVAYLEQVELELDRQWVQRGWKRLFALFADKNGRSEVVDYAAPPWFRLGLIKRKRMLKILGIVVDYRYDYDMDFVQLHITWKPRRRIWMKSSRRGVQSI